MTIATRIEVGTCKMGDVFIFERHHGSEGDSWMVRAGNHTVGTYDTQAQAEAVARALVGDDRLNDAALDAIAPEPEPEPEIAAPVRPLRK